jgi:phosphoribosyl-ATP pyrophosphohydrolase
MDHQPMPANIAMQCSGILRELVATQVDALEELSTTIVAEVAKLSYHHSCLVQNHWLHWQDLMADQRQTSL